VRMFDRTPVDQGLLRCMAAQLEHRGPDDEGFLIRGSVGFGHKRLSIIDVEHSTQPMSSVDGSLHVCFNGEILNYKELRRETPYPYQTSGDTEVLLSSFDRYGARAVERLMGQFAYALYSERDDSLWLFRDRLGILPLYYYCDAHMLAFASEIKALLPALPRAPHVDIESLDAYLARRSVPAPWTLFAGVRKLSPGCALEIGPEGLRSEPQPYWQLPEPSDASNLTDEQAVDALETRLLEAVRRNLVADVPVGAYLSGGVDSSLLTALMRSIAPDQEIRTFSATFGDPRFDESAYARSVADQQRTMHEEVHVGGDDFLRLWPRLTWHRDAPISEASDVAVYRLAQLASQHVKVVLSGEGSDELFGGYPKHRFARLSSGSGILPAAAREIALNGIEQRLPKSAFRPRILLRALSGRTEAARLEGWFAPFTERERERLLQGQSQHARNGLESLKGDALRRMLVWDLQGWLTDNLLERGDRMSMAASLELRPPFLDVDVVEFAFALTSNLKVRHAHGKWIVRQLARRHLPAKIVERAKVGFRVPLDEWFRGQLRDFARDTLLSGDSFAVEYLHPQAVRALLDRHESGRSNEELRIWTLLSLEVWHRTFFRQATAVTARSFAPLTGARP
jgi:asparagine synthase (glutamine-hydrolysing)